METVKFKINGLHCMGCVKTSKSLIGQIKGIKSVEIKDVDGEAEVNSDNKVDMAIIETVIKDAGYSITK